MKLGPSEPVAPCSRPLQGPPPLRSSAGSKPWYDLGWKANDRSACRTGAPKTTCTGNSNRPERPEWKDVGTNTTLSYTDLLGPFQRHHARETSRMMEELALKGMCRVSRPQEFRSCLLSNLGTCGTIWRGSSLPFLSAVPIMLHPDGRESGLPSDQRGQKTSKNQERRHHLHRGEKATPRP